MSVTYDDCAGVETSSESFWEVGNYKRTVRRIDDGYRLCNDLMACIQERAKIEKVYSQQLTDWTKKWKTLIERGPQYGSMERAWQALMTEADRVSDLHHEMRNQINNEDLEKIKNWQKDTFHKQLIGGFKETKEAEDGFRKAQKPWAKKLKELEVLKKAYHLACKEERLAVSRETSTKSDPGAPPDQAKKLSDKVEKCRQDTQKAKERYEKGLEEMGRHTPQYTENMEAVFETCQQLELKRLSFLKEVLMDIQRHLDLSTNCSYANVYRDFRQSILTADEQDDLKWFAANHGTGMATNWPAFEEYSPDAPQTTSRKEKGGGLRKTAEGGVAQGPTESPSVHGGSARASTSEASGPADWSDDDTPLARGGSSGGRSNGDKNPFDEADGGSAAGSGNGGGRIRALYDYQGQEQDELSFKAGDELTKLEEEDEQGWCKGRMDDGTVGLFPANYVEDI
ncbi:protein kinase C and casein kinase substrate in neurons protein 1 [Lethenteron reissneri]|uniref:protein kinase C and casein kinase substrate in neurons protein 1 n=1 Tax=Lethenteron reissneri TaxID=7753 RepID=UPI002AB602FD|nr:protein kinase C and casein kinase substrate in neurons protein 1 [Lethenteron reissneri]XP_061420782.1 protein kinase C and casein kinase substrate in neurons protein 1 [Lethenteron reissneri]